MFAKSANFANISSNGEEPPPPELPTKPLSPLGRRIMKTVQATPAGLDTNELGRQVGNGKGASSLMVERELEDLARCGLLARTNGRWVMTRVQS